MTEYDFLDKEFAFLENSEGIREDLWNMLHEHKRKYAFPNLYYTLDSYVFKYGLSFGVNPIYIDETETIYGYHFYIKNHGTYFRDIPIGLSFPDDIYKSHKECWKKCVNWVIYKIEGEK
ncbi:hypothetical protein LJB87_02070 [Alistipes sp. OttesenSCG-928-L06]|nr:hypothetical protein [Alistipes sp. OttesenSCG-928-L06]